MSLMNCPKCGKEISSEMTVCIHCECKISVCPDCGNAEIGDVSVCSKCGYVFAKNDIGLSERGGNVGADCETSYRNWLEKSPIRSFLHTKKRLINIFVNVVTMVLLVVFLWIFYKWYSADALQQLEDYKKVLNAKWLVILFIIIECFPVEGAIDFCLTLSLCNWLRENKVDNLAAIRKFLNTVVDSSDTHYILFLALYRNAIFMCENGNGMRRYFYKYAILLAFRVMMIVGFIVFINSNLNPIMFNIWMDIPITKSSFTYVGLIVGAVGIVINIVFDVIDITCFEKLQDRWKQSVSANNQ